MCRCSFLHAPAIVDNLHERFKGKGGVKSVYTYCGQICIAVNPYMWIQELYSVDVMNRYMGARFEDNMPHVYAVADAAYTAMVAPRDSGKAMDNQSILVSGESGAGKTESVKIMMEYLAQLGGRSGGATNFTDVAEAVIKANPLLESFGNAKTLLNDNSSRFGKFTKIIFDKNGAIIGARVDVYLLEKSRVVRQAAGERNYHIFYQLLASRTLGEEKRHEMGLTSPGDFGYVNEITVEGVDDEKEFNDMQESMEIVGIPADQQLQIFTAVAATLWLSKVRFEKGISDGGDEKAILSDDSDAPIALVSRLLHVVPEDLGQALVSRQMHARGESYSIVLSLVQAEDVRDALAKGLYSKLFAWLVRIVNIGTQTADIKQVEATIGVLDIFGFESFAHNSLEQLLINFANEKLQQQFTWYVFKLEQQEYDKEEISWTAVDFQDNQPVLDVLEGYGSVLALLQEECQMQKGTDLNFRTKMVTASKRFPKVKDPENGRLVDSLSFNMRSQITFTIRHYAGPVEYDVTNFTEKNKDSLQPDLIGVMQNSGIQFVQDLFRSQAQATSTRGSSKQQGLGGQFKSSLGSLVESINLTGVHYVRCIKPNLNKSSSEFNVRGVNDQLRCQGILEAIRIARAAYPNRMTHYDLTVRYQLCLRDEELAKDATAAGSIIKKFASVGEVASAHLLMDNLNVVEFQVGRTKVFFKREAMEALEAARARVVDSFLIRLQAASRMSIYSARFRKIKESALHVQRIARGRAARQHFRRVRCAIAAQARWRSYSRRKKFVTYRASAIQIQVTQIKLHSFESSAVLSAYLAPLVAWQGGFRRMEAVKDAHNRRIDANVAILQALVRRQPELEAYTEARRAATVMQKNARAFNAHRLYLKKRDESRLKAMLENRLEEAEASVHSRELELESLRQQLQEEQRLRAEQQELRERAEARVAALASEMSEMKTHAVTSEADSTRAALEVEVAQLKTDIATLSERHAEELRWVPVTG